MCIRDRSRRINAKFKQETNKETNYLHTLNGSGLAVGRTMIAILENYQESDGSVTVPMALRKYMEGIEKIIPKK